jgi:hypothetical protein
MGEATEGREGRERREKEEKAGQYQDDVTRNFLQIKKHARRQARQVQAPPGASSSVTPYPSRTLLIGSSLFRHQARHQQMRVCVEESVCMVSVCGSVYAKSRQAVQLLIT